MVTVLKTTVGINGIELTFIYVTKICDDIGKDLVNTIVFGAFSGNFANGSYQRQGPNPRGQERTLQDTASNLTMSYVGGNPKEKFRSDLSHFIDEYFLRG